MIRLSYYPDTWTFPGGGIKRGETPEGALVRECKEEVGLTPQNLRVVGEVLFEHEYKKDLVTVFQCEAPSFDFNTDDGEVIEARWFEKDALPLMGSNARKFLGLCNL